MEVRFAKNHLRLGDAIGQRGDLSSPGIGQGKAWENHGKTMGKPWENIGKPWEIPGISVDCCGLLWILWVWCWDLWRWVIINGQQVTFDCQRVCPLVNIPKSYRTPHIEWQKNMVSGDFCSLKKSNDRPRNIKKCGGRARPRGAWGSMKYLKVRIFKGPYI